MPIWLGIAAIAVLLLFLAALLAHAQKSQLKSRRPASGADGGTDVASWLGGGAGASAAHDGHHGASFGDGSHGGVDACGVGGDACGGGDGGGGGSH